MSESVWNGSNGNYLDPDNWSNGQVPQDGNDGFITAGVAHVAEATITANIWLFSTHPVHDPELSLDNTTIIGPYSDEGLILVASPTETAGTSFGDLDVAGEVSDNGVIVVGQDEGDNGNLDIRLAAGATLENNNAIEVDSGSFVDVTGKSGSSLSNTGADDNWGILVFGKMVIDVPITGTGGGINLASSSVGRPSLTINRSVSAGQTVKLNDPDYVGPGPQSEATLRLGEPMKFLGTVEAGVSSRVVLTNSHETRFSYLKDILKVYDHDHVIASFAYTADAGTFTVSNSGLDVIVETPSAPTYSLDQHPVASMIGSHS